MTNKKCERKMYSLKIFFKCQLRTYRYVNTKAFSCLQELANKCKIVIKALFLKFFFSNRFQVLLVNQI